MHASAKEKREICLFKAWEDSELLSALADLRTLLFKNPLYIENALTLLKWKIKHCREKTAILKVYFPNSKILLLKKKKTLHFLELTISVS